MEIPDPPTGPQLTFWTGQNLGECSYVPDWDLVTNLVRVKDLACRKSATARFLTVWTDEDTYEVHGRAYPACPEHADWARAEKAQYFVREEAV